MRKYNCLFLLATLMRIFTGSNSFAQTAPHDSSSQQNAFNNAVTLYYTSLKDQLPLYNGPEYFFYDPALKGNAYFMEVRAFTPGSINYDGVYYTNMPMLYDLYSDDITVLLFNHYSKYALQKYRVRSFDFLGHHFVNIDADTVNASSGLKSGYYDALYAGKTEVLVKRSKNIQNSGGSLTSERIFVASRDFYIRKNKVYYNVSSQSSLVNVFKDKKKEIQKYFKTNQLRFREDQEEAMVQLATYYDQLTN